MKNRYDKNMIKIDMIKYMIKIRKKIKRKNMYDKNDKNKLS